MNKYIVWTFIGEYHVIAPSEEDAKRKVQILTRFRISRDEMNVTYHGRAY